MKQQKKLDTTMNKKLKNFKTEIKSDNTTTFNSLNMKLSTITSNKNYSYYY